jgi:hypothetical protein
MKIIKVKFANSHYEKVYYYRTQLNFIKNGVYEIIADNKTCYDNYITVIEDNVSPEEIPFGISLREITSAKIVGAPPKPTGEIENIYLNEDKGVVVIKWTDGTKTKVKCQDGEDFDAEKGIALCFMKRAFHNRGCYNDVFKKYIGEVDE